MFKISNFGIKPLKSAFNLQIINPELLVEYPSYKFILIIKLNIAFHSTTQQQ